MGKALRYLDLRGRGVTPTKNRRKIKKPHRADSEEKAIGGPHEASHHYAQARVSNVHRKDLAKTWENEERKTVDERKPPPILKPPATNTVTKKQPTVRSGTDKKKERSEESNYAPPTTVRYGVFSWSSRRCFTGGGPFPTLRLPQEQKNANRGIEGPSVEAAAQK